MNVKPKRKVDQSEATRAALIAAARPLFAERGFAGVGTEEIVRAAGVTRGALYHHFSGKDDLFRAVFEQVEIEVTERIAQGALSDPDPLAALRAGAEMFLDSCLEPEVQRIVLIDAPSVLGWEGWREVASAYGLGLIKAALAGAIEAGALDPQPVDPLAHVLMGALDEAAMYVAQAEDPKTAREEAAAIFEHLIESLRASS
jgi:AcrR family transcriptional regulator